MTPADRERILAAWADATTWVNRQWHELRRIEQTSPTTWPTAIRHRFDRADPEPRRSTPIDTDPDRSAHV